MTISRDNIDTVDLNLGVTGNPWGMTDREWAAMCELFEFDHAEAFETVNGE
jgi:hypothetical protein